MQSIRKTESPETDAPQIKKNNEGGFSLIEVIVAMIILLVALLGVFLTFTYAVNYNAGNYARSQALVVLQQEVELMRSAKFTPGVTDTTLTGGVKAAKTVSTANGNRFRVNITVDDDPIATGVQTSTSSTLKEITIVVSSESPTPGWQSAVPAKVYLRRVRSN